MPWMYALFVATALCQAPAPDRVLLLNDPAQTSFEQQLVHHILTQKLLADASCELVSQAPLQPAAQRASALRQAAQQHLTHARQALRELAPEKAFVAAAQARQKLTRAAIWSGDCQPLCDSLALEAAALLHLQERTAASQVLQELMTLHPAWHPEASLYNPAMQAAVARARRRLHQAPMRKLLLDSNNKDAALFVDGVLVGFGRAQLSVAVHVPHYIWAMAADGPSSGTMVAAEAGPIGAAQRMSEDDPSAMTVHLSVPDAQQWPELDERFATAVHASRAAGSAFDPGNKAIRAMDVQRILVLAYAQGTLILTEFDLHLGKRTQRRVSAAITDIWDALHAGSVLLQSSPAALPLAAIPTD